MLGKLAKLVCAAAASVTATLTFGGVSPIPSLNSQLERVGVLLVVSTRPGLDGRRP